VEHKRAKHYCRGKRVCFRRRRSARLSRTLCRQSAAAKRNWLPNAFELADAARNQCRSRNVRGRRYGRGTRLMSTVIFALGPSRQEARPIFRRPRETSCQISCVDVSKILRVGRASIRTNRRSGGPPKTRSHILPEGTPAARVSLWHLGAALERQDKKRKHSRITLRATTRQPDLVRRT